MNRILYLCDHKIGSHVIQCAGFQAAAAKYNWQSTIIECALLTRPLREHLRQWRPQGCVLDIDNMDTSTLRKIFKDIPVVLMDSIEVKRSSRWNHVVGDARKIAELAEAELRQSKPKSFAYIGWSSKLPWSDSRGHQFAELVSAHGGTCAMMTEGWDVGDILSAQRTMSDFLRKLPTPVGIFAANDYTACQVTEACRLLNWECPRDFLLVGVDNESMWCELCNPTITSIEIDLWQSGQMAADLLAKIIAHPQAKPERRTFGPTRIVRRQSTRSMAHNDSRISHAVEYIRQNTMSGITAAKVLKEIPLSRRLSEKLFLRATGHTIIQEIQSVRLEKIKELLLTDVPIGCISGMCGMKSDSYLKRLFRRHTGMTPREWRERHRNKKVAPKV